MIRTIRPLASRLILAAGLVACLAGSAAAQEGQLRGIVRDRDGQGIAGATVRAESGYWNVGFDETTDGSGRFSLIGLNRGEWLVVIRADGFQPIQGFADVRGGGQTMVRFRMERDMLNPPAPAAGILAGLKASEIVASLEDAESLFDGGEYDAAIDAYRSILERVPALTSLNLQIGHAFGEKQEPDQALAAYRAALDADPLNAEAQATLDVASQTAR